MEARLEWLQEGLVKQQSDMESALHRDDSNARWELDQQVAELADIETLAEQWLSQAKKCLQSQQANHFSAMSASGSLGLHALGAAQNSVLASAEF